MVARYKVGAGDLNMVLGVDSFVDLVNLSFWKTPKGVAWLFVLYFSGWELWLTQNALVFQGQRKRIWGARVTILAKEVMLTVCKPENSSRKQVWIKQVGWFPCH